MWYSKGVVEIDMILFVIIYRPNSSASELAQLNKGAGFQSQAGSMWFVVEKVVARYFFLQYL